MKSKNKQIKEIGINLLLGLTGVGFALVVGEIGLRIVGISYPSFYQADEYRGHALVPNLSSWWTHEGKGYVKINSDGLRDKEHNQQKSKNTLRIAVLGDSFAEAIQLDAEKTFWSVIEKDLEKCPAIKGKNVEVINFGVGDYGTAQELMTLKHHVWNYNPDIVILAIFTGNDILNNSRTLSPPDRFSPFLVKRDGKFGMDMSFKDTKDYQWRTSILRKIMFSIINNSQIFQLLNEVRVSIKNRRDLLGIKSQSNEAVNLSQMVDFQPQLYQSNSDKNWQEAWKATEELVKLTNQEVKTNNADFLAVTLSNPAQVYPDISNRKQYFQKAGVTDVFYPDKRIKSLGERENFEVLNLAQPFQKYADKQHVFLHGFENTALGIGHWNEKGHQLAGELITEKLCQNLQQK